MLKKIGAHAMISDIHNIRYHHMSAQLTDQKIHVFDDSYATDMSPHSQFGSINDNVRQISLQKRHLWNDTLDHSLHTISGHRCCNYETRPCTNIYAFDTYRYMVLVVDPRMAGISGDMMLSALVDMGADSKEIVSQVQKYISLINGASIDAITFEKISKGGIACTRMILEARDPPRISADQMVQAICDAATRMKLSPAAVSFAARCINVLVSAESRIHGGEAHLHEVASADTFVDIVGTASALDQLNIFNDIVFTTPVNIGSGTVTFSHGTFPNPAPAVLDILKDAKIAMFGDNIGYESATPTGACILAALESRSVPFYPYVTPRRTGYGAGSRDLKDRANALLLISGDSHPAAQDSVSVIETNLDDVTGEILGDTISKAISMGALDATIQQGTGKKGRPVYMITILCGYGLVEDITDMLVRRTGTLGVRITRARRYTLSREHHTASVKIMGIQYDIRYKRYTHRGAPGFKIEFDDTSQISAKTGIPPRDVERLARRAIEDDDTHT